MIYLDGFNYLMYKNYRALRAHHKPETVSKAMDFDHDAADDFECWYQREINGEPVGVNNLSRGVAVLEL